MLWGSSSRRSQLQVHVERGGRNGVLFEEKSRARIHTSRPDNRCVAFSILFVFVGAIKFQEGLVGYPL